MENQIYRIDGSPKSEVEFFICSTNELDPHRNIKELGLVVLKEGLQIDVSFDAEQLKSLIKYLNEAKVYIDDFNSQSKPTNP